MPDSTEGLRLILEVVAAGGVVGSGIVTLLKLGAIGNQIMTHGTVLKTQGEAIDKIEETMATLAVQREEIRSIREVMSLNTKRTDETFSRVFTRLDNLPK
ncbi:MAG TPA: hypothetical protein VF748_15045 [Candidatus Acidoferrum sp.]